MDGTIYLDSTPIGDMINTLKICRDKGIKIYYFTNNSSKNHIEYVKKLSKIGFYDDRDIVYTSAMATIGFLNSEFKGKSVYILATDEVKKSFIEGNIGKVDKYNEWITSQTTRYNDQYRDKILMGADFPEDIREAFVPEIMSKYPFLYAVKLFIKIIESESLDPIKEYMDSIYNESKNLFKKYLNFDI